jgi:hypothetical protein
LPLTVPPSMPRMATCEVGRQDVCIACTTGFFAARIDATPPCAAARGAAGANVGRPCSFLFRCSRCYLHLVRCTAAKRATEVARHDGWRVEW